MMRAANTLPVVGAFSGEARSTFFGGSTPMKSVKTIIGARETVTVGPEMSVREAATTMARHQIGAVPVVERDRLVGIFTERDVLARVVAGGLDPQVTPVGDVMSTQLVVAEVNEPCEACLQRMQQARVRHLIVLDQGRLGGVLSIRDLMAVDLDEKDEAIAMLNAYVHYVPADSRAKAHT
jgi:CBS domain-containing protein